MTNMRGVLRKIADFAGEPKMKSLDLAEIEKFTEYTTIKRYPRRFGMVDIQHNSRRVINYCMNIRKYNVKVSGIVKSVSRLKTAEDVSPELIRVLEYAWKKFVTPVTGYESYQSMLDAK